MPEAKLWLETRNGLTRSARVSAANVDGGALTRYFIYFRHNNEAIAIEDEHELHPRWSDSSLGLIAYALAKIIEARPTQRGTRLKPTGPHVHDPVVQIDISVSVCPDGPAAHLEYEGIRASIANDVVTCTYRNEAYVGTPIEVPIKLDEDICRLSLALITGVLYGNADRPPAPLPLRVQVRRWGAMEYVLLSDLPEAIRCRFRQLSPHVRKLGIPFQAPDNCIRASEWDAFLSNSQIGDSGFGPGVSLFAV